MAAQLDRGWSPSLVKKPDVWTLGVVADIRFLPNIIKRPRAAYDGGATIFLLSLFAPFLLLARLCSFRIPVLSVFSFVVVPVLELYSLAHYGVIIDVPILLLVEAILWLLILTEIQTWSRSLGLPVVTILVLWGIFLSALGWNYRHHVGTLDFQRDSAAPKNVRTLFSEWLEARPDKDSYKNRPYPVVLVAAEGGGIRAAYITAELLTYLQTIDPSFRRHLFAVSGVSRGAVGASVFTAACNSKEVNQRLLEELPEKVLTERNFLSGPVAALLGPEIFQRILPIQAPLLKHVRELDRICIDRATALERSLEGAFEETTGSQEMKVDFAKAYDPAASSPLLFLMPLMRLLEGG
jgi:hypothetical protein